MVYLSMDVDCGIGDFVASERRIVGIEESYIAPIFERMMPRFLDFADQHGIVVTFFLVASTVNTPARRALLRRMVQAGHEIGSHSLTHPKALGRLPDDELRNEIEGSKRLLEEASGTEVAGFRAPGFYINDRVLQAVIDAGYRYSSSVNSALGYNLAKLGVGTAVNLLSGGGATYHLEPLSLLAPKDPYRPAGRFWRAGDGPPFYELPVSMGFGRMLPGITFAIDTMLPARMRAPFFQRMVHRLPAANIVLHDFEFLEPDDFDPATPLPRTTAMLWKVPRAAKWRQLSAMAKKGESSFGRLSDLAQKLGARAPGDAERPGRPSPNLG